MAVEDRAVRVTYACKCLNIRITSSASPSEGPDYPPDPNYIPVFVKDDGIQINHPQATVRLLSRPLPISGTTRHSRFTALTCLFCALNVYRVHHVISLDVEGNETTLLPSEDWVEREILKSGTGWIDVHKDCLPTGRVADALSSPTYASLFSLLLPEMSSPPSSFDIAHDGENSPTTDEKREEGSYLLNMKPIFLPPPFTPSNPVFIHLAEISNKQSQELRTAAEDRIREFIESETSGIVEKERDIRHQAESLWKEFRRHLAELQLEPGRYAARSARSPSRSRDGATTNGVANSRPTSSVAVKTFIPTTVSSSVRHTSPPRPRVSTLSASLATSTFHHPRTQNRTSLVEITPNPDSKPSHSPSTRSDSSTLVHSAQQAECSNVLQFKRNVNDDINTQASYRYFIDLEEDVRRYKQSKEDAKNPEATESGPSRPPDASSSKEGTKIQVVVKTSEPQAQATPSRGRDKGKRKVTFDVKPAVVTIVKDEKEAISADQEAMFPLDDVVSEEVAEAPAHDQQTTLPLLEQPPPRPITIRKRSQNAVGDAFHTLRPVSLPAPSHIRPIRSPPGVDSSSPSVLAGLPKASSSTKALPKTLKYEPPLPSPLTEPDVELLKLVAADTPSHRGAWLQGSENWKSITSNRDMKGGENKTDEDEEVAKSAPVVFIRNTVGGDDCGDTSAHVVGSLPIKIKKPELPKLLSLASYVGQDGPVTSPVVTTANNGKKPSSNAVRKALSLDRDRARSMDPGPLDSVIEEDELGDAEIACAKEEGEKARKQALRILKARSEIPEEGMWRSLA